MKNKLILFALSTLALVTGCKDDDDMNIAEVSTVEQLYAPDNNAYFNLGAQSSTVFEWQHSLSADNGVVLYDVVFDEEGGDFSDPVYVTPADGQGFQTQLTMSFTQLNQIAQMAGIQPETTGRLIWTVWSSKGLNVTPANEYRTIEVERPAGFPTPDELFITGSATEAGTDVANAVPMKRTGTTTYEIYTSLQPGTYQFVSRITGTPEVFYIDGTNLRADGETTVTTDTQVYRIRVDFSDGSVSMSTIDNVEIWFPPVGDYLFNLTYSGNGTWQALDEYIEFHQESWGRDERYKFKFTVTTNGVTAEEWFGSTNMDNNRPDNSPAPSYWFMIPREYSYWDYCFKFASAVDYSNVNISIMFNTDVEEYTHEITVL